MITVQENGRYAIGDLAHLAGVSRRTIRYYVQEGLLQAPLGRGRGKHYGQGHLDRILKIKALQEEGLTLEAIRAILQSDENATGTRRMVAEEPMPWEPVGESRKRPSTGSGRTEKSKEIEADTVRAEPVEAPAWHSLTGSWVPEEARPRFGAPEDIPPESGPERSAWVRVELGPGIELHISADHRVPSPRKLREVAEWCRREIRRDRKEGG